MIFLQRWSWFFLLSLMIHVWLIWGVKWMGVRSVPKEHKPMQINLMALVAPHASAPTRRKNPLKSQTAPDAAKEKQAVNKIIAPIIEDNNIPEEVDLESMVEPEIDNKPEPPQQERTAFARSQDTAQDSATVIREANYRKQTAPVYPRLALRRGIEGVVELHVEVLPSGLPDEIQIALSSGFSMLDMAALSAVKQWEFEPTQVGGKPVASWVRVPVRFVIQ